MKRYWAKYRGKVVNNVDPLEKARLQVQVPTILDSVTDLWAMPATPYGGPGVGLFALPPVGANVWVEFEGGDLRLPVWTGDYWTKKEDVPVSPAHPDVKVFRTPALTVAENEYDGGEVKAGNLVLKKGLTVNVGSPVVEGFLRMFMGVDDLIEITNNDEEIIRMNKESIVLIKDQNTVVTLTKDDITLTHDPVTIKMLSQSKTIEITNGTATIKMNGEEIDSTIGSADVKMTESGVTVSFMDARIHLSAEGINISFEPTSIKLSVAAVAVNGEALTVLPL